jgi:hypothetical protein
MMPAFSGGMVLMRKVMLCGLVLLCSCVSFSQTVPQWKVVKAVFLRNRTAAIQETTLFTPTENGLYRLSGYMSASNLQGIQNAFWSFILRYTDLTQLESNSSMLVQGNGGVINTIDSHVFAVLKGTPISYEVIKSDNPPPPPDAEYTIAFTIEQLK